MQHTVETFLTCLVLQFQALPKQGQKGSPIHVMDIFLINTQCNILLEHFLPLILNIFYATFDSKINKMFKAISYNVFSILHGEKNKLN